MAVTADTRALPPGLDEHPHQVLRPGQAPKSVGRSRQRHALADQRPDVELSRGQELHRPSVLLDPEGGPLFGRPARIADHNRIRAHLSNAAITCVTRRLRPSGANWYCGTLNLAIQSV